MNRLYCDKEKQVLQALGDSEWDDSLRDHASECPICKDLVVVAEFMRDEAELTKAAPLIPNATFIWWKAELASRRGLVSRATRPIRVAKTLAYITSCVIVVWFLFWLDQGQQWMQELSKQTSHTLPLGEFALLAALVTIASALAGSLYLMWAEK